MYLLTYSKPHRKTQDLVFRLGCKGIRPILVIQDWVDRKNYVPLYPTKLPPADIDPVDLGLDTCKMENIPKGSVVIIGGAGILPADFVKDNIVVNVHCGWLPKVRGLDALKWAIYYDYPIGCTTHIVDEHCDRGLLLGRQKVELSSTDSLYSIAMKQYELEINMMVECIVNNRWTAPKEFEETGNEPNRRMSHKKELVMMKRLEKRLCKLE